MTTSSGLVFDIKRFATHDGNGIRTTVFLKGCPLRCAWCQNPEGLSVAKQVLYMDTNCIHCRSCVAACKNQGITFENHKICVHREVEEDWETVIDVCPTNALRFDCQVYSIPELMDEIKKDEAFFKYGGGVTFSGGEPFLQFEFLKEALMECKKLGFHTAIESSFYTKNENVKEVLPYLDQIYCDLKAWNDDEHVAYTKVHNTQIKENISYLLHSDKKEKVIIRTPLIPELTANDQNIDLISNFIVDEYNDVSYEILNYNPLAKAKYKYLDMEYCFEENPKMYSNEQMQHFYDIALKNGVKNLKIE